MNAESWAVEILMVVLTGLGGFLAWVVRASVVPWIKEMREQGAKESQRRISAMDKVVDAVEETTHAMKHSKAAQDRVERMLEQLFEMHSEPAPDNKFETVGLKEQMGLIRKIGREFIDLWKIEDPSPADVLRTHRAMEELLEEWGAVIAKHT